MSDPLYKKYGRTAQPGEVLFEQGDTGEEMYVIRSGKVRVYIVSNGVEKTLAELGAGEFLGEMSILNKRPRTASAVVIEETNLLVVGSKVLEEMVIGSTEIALRLIRKLAKRLESADSLIEVLLFRDPKDRVVENLKRLITLHGGDTGQAITIAASADEMAEQLGLQLSETQDIIGRLVRSGAITELEGAWVVKEPDRLDELRDFLKMKSQYR